MSKIFFVKQLEESVAKEICTIFPYGRVGIFGVDEKLITAIIKHGNTVCYISEGEEISQDVRYIVVDDNIGRLNYIRGAAWDRKIVVVASAMSMPIVHNIAIMGIQTISLEPPMYIFYANRDCADNCLGYKKVIFGLYAEVLDVLCGEAVFCRELLALKQSLEEAMMGELGAEALIRLAHLAAAVLQRQPGRSVIAVVELVSAIFQNNICDSYFLNYLGILMLLQFTLYENCGIFVGADRVAVRQLIGVNNGAAPLPKTDLLFIKDKTYLVNLLPSREELFIFITRCITAEEKKRISSRQISLAIKSYLIANEISNCTGLMSQLCTKGFIEELTYESKN